MTHFKVNNQPSYKTFDGFLTDLFGNFENVLKQDYTGKTPPANIVETAEGYHLEIAAPGRNKENFKLKAEANLLTISYHETPAPADATTSTLKQVRKEFSIAAFTRSFTLDETTTTEGILAKYEDGLLKVFVPKKAVIPPTVTEIKVG
jgi:HSP20 family protein